MGEICPVPAPMEWVEAIEAAQSLGRHGALHRMHRRIGAQAEDRRMIGLHLTTRIPEVPGDEIHFGVNVASGASHRAITRELGIVEKTAAIAYWVWSRIEAPEGN